MIKDIRAKRCIDDACINIEETVALEEHVSIVFGRYRFETYASPEGLKEMAIGHLVASGLIKDKSQISSIAVANDGTGHSIRVSGKGGKREKWPMKRMRLDPKKIFHFNSVVTSSSGLFDRTGAFHYAFIFDNEGNLLQRACDIGRMNAIDKAVGKALEDEVQLDGKILYTTGSIASRTVEKAINTSMPIIISKAPPMYEAIRLAKENGITIIGFSRENRYNVYTDEDNGY